MTKLTPQNIASIAPIPNGSIIKKVDDNNFAEVTASDITALGIWWSVIEKTETFVAGESISIGDHVSKILDISQTTNNAIFNTSASAFTFWIAFNNPLSRKIVSADIYIEWYRQWVNDYIISTDIYNASWTPWSWATATWWSLYNTPSQTTTLTAPLPFAWYQIWQTHIYSNSTIGVWNYVLQVSVNIVWAWSNARTIWIWSAFAWTNYLFNNVADNNKAPLISITFDDWDTVVLSSWTHWSERKYVWQSLESKTIWQNVLVKTRWVLSQTWATWSWEIRYLSNTLGDISTTPWTNKVYVGRWYSTDNISIRWLADFSLDSVSYGNLSFSWASQVESFYLSWWWILNFSSSTSLWWSSIVSLSYQISKDWIWRTTLWAISSTSWGNETSQNSISIPANHYFRWSFGQDVSWWTATVTNINLIPF